GEPADVGDDERLSERESTDRRAGRLAHGWRAERDDRVAGRHQRPQAPFLDVVLADDAVRDVEAREPLGQRADEQQAGTRTACPQARERCQQLRDALALVQVSEAAEERLSAYRGGGGPGERPGGMRDPPDRSGVPA